MKIQCPHCSTGYKLPEHLLGPRGARVRCPKCGKSFEVLRTPESPATSSEDALDAELLEIDLPEDEVPKVVSWEEEVPEADPPLTPSESEEALGLPPMLEEPDDVAARILDALAARLGERLEASHAEGKLWAEHGEELMRAWDEYRQALGSRADAAVFRAGLRARWNIELGPGGPLSGQERAS